MKTNVYTIYDHKAALYRLPFHQVNDDVAIRTAKHIANDPNSDISKAPEDYHLMQVGEWDDVQGRLTSIDPPRPVVAFLALVPRS